MHSSMFKGLDEFLTLAMICIGIVAVAILAGIGWGIYELIAWAV